MAFGRRVSVELLFAAALCLIHQSPAALTIDKHPGYRVTQSSAKGGQDLIAFLEVVRPSTDQFGPDIEELRVSVSYETHHRLHVHITSKAPPPARWEVPQQLIPRSQGQLPPQLDTFPSSSNANVARELLQNSSAAAARDTQFPSELQFSYTADPFGFSVSRKSTGEVLFNSTPSPFFGNLVFKDQYLEISTAIPQDASLYGLGESTRPDGLLLHPGQTYTLWTSDVACSNKDINLYGAHPFYMDVRTGGSTHGVLLLNSNGMDISYEADRLTYKVIGGILDFYFFDGPDPLSVMDQYTELVGRPAPMPYWSLGFHQCKYGYTNISDVEAVVSNYRDANIPLEVMWNDIDYMDQYRDFSTDPVNFPAKEFRAFVEKLHANDQRFVMIIDPGISTNESYSTYRHGMEKDIFIKHGGKPYLAQVWPGPVHFPDFLHPNIDSFWASEISDFHDIIPFDGLWIDMNEASNFCSGTICMYPSSGNYSSSNDIDTCSLVCSNANWTRWDDPPYKINNLGINRAIGIKTIATSATHFGGFLEYDAHNLYGFSEAVVTNRALKSVIKKRPFVLSRSSFPGTGAYSAHWTGDNSATWNDLAYSLVGVLNSGIFGVPMVGADICGFTGDTWEELCNRWIQVGAFYPFSRDHSDIHSIRQELYMWESVAQSARKSLGLRYRLLPYLYTLAYEAHSSGAPMARPLFFSFPDDPTCLNISTQFLIGKGVLVSPVLTGGVESVTAYFPMGTWYNLFNLSQVVNATNGNYETLPAPLDTINVHVHEGTILPLQEEALTTTSARKTPFSLLIAFPLDGSHRSNGAAAFGQLFLDDGEEMEMKVEAGKSSFIKFLATISNQSVEVASSVTSGDFALMQGWILTEIVILGLHESSSNKLLVNGKPAPASVQMQWYASDSRVKVFGLNIPIGKDFNLEWKLWI